MTFRLFVLILSLFLAVPLVARANENLTISTGFTSPVSTIYQKILAHACKQIGIKFTFQEMPAERSLILVNDGINDAECCRIPTAVQKEYPNLIAVPESVLLIEFSAFSNNPSIRLKKWEDLKPYSIGTVTGWKIVVSNIERVKPENYVILDEIDPLFKMLDLGRIDIAVIGELSGLDSIKRQGIKGIHVIDPPMAAMPVHLMLHGKHAKLVPRFDQVFKAMKADGSMDRIIKEVMR